MKKLSLLLPLLLAACASQPESPEFATPMCASDRECEAKWNAAEIWIQHNLGRPIVAKTDTMMRTEMSQSPGNYLSALVEKEPLGDGRWKIEATMYCAMRVGCDPSPWQQTQSFNRAVNNAWKVIRKPDGTSE